MVATSGLGDLGESALKGPYPEVYRSQNHVGFPRAERL